MPKKKATHWYAVYCRDEDGFWRDGEDDTKSTAWVEMPKDAKVFGPTSSLFPMEECLEVRDRLAGIGWDVLVVVLTAKDFK